MMRFDFGHLENGSECPEQTTLTAILRLTRRTTLYELGDCLSIQIQVWYMWFVEAEFPLGNFCNYCDIDLFAKMD